MEREVELELQYKEQRLTKISDISIPSDDDNCPGMVKCDGRGYYNEN